MVGTRSRVSRYAAARPDRRASKNGGLSDVTSDVSQERAALDLRHSSQRCSCDQRAYVEAHRRAKEQAGGNLDVLIQLLVEEALKCEAVARGLKADAHQRMRRNGCKLSYP